MTIGVQLLCASPVRGQSIGDVKVNLVLRNETLIDVFQKIEANSKYHFMYRKDEVKKVRNLSASYVNTSIEDLLKYVLRETALTYKQVGDQILCHVAGLLSARLRAQDMVGRYGGEEFLVLLPNTAQQAAAELAETLRSAVAQCPCAREGCAITATVSIGVCGGQLHGTEDWERLLRCADQALYAAKAAGRNRVVSGRFVPEAAQPLATPVI